jgi:SAM-dependent methyltransferase
LKSANVIVEVGPGAGGLSSLIAPRAKKRHVIVDQSLRCVLLARSRARVAAGTHADRVRGVVASAEALPFADGSVDTLVAENLVDLLDDPETRASAATTTTNSPICSPKRASPSTMSSTACAGRAYTGHVTLSCGPASACAARATADATA